MNLKLAHSRTPGRATPHRQPQPKINPSRNTRPAWRVQSQLEFISRNLSRIQPSKEPNLNHHDTSNAGPPGRARAANPRNQPQTNTPPSPRNPHQDHTPIKNPGFPHTPLAVRHRLIASPSQTRSTRPARSGSLERLEVDVLVSGRRGRWSVSRPTNSTSCVLTFDGIFDYFQKRNRLFISDISARQRGSAR